jgi:hypothetical protein
MKNIVITAVLGGLLGGLLVYGGINMLLWQFWAILAIICVLMERCKAS